jgi:pimeloyl-ACP methyl ester carboxylesterase
MFDPILQNGTDLLTCTAGAAAPLALFPLNLASRASAVAMDRFVANKFLTPTRSMRKKSSTESLSHEDRMTGLKLIGEFYASEEEKPGERPAFFPRPAPVDPAVRRIGAFAEDGEVLDLSWPSEFEPLWSTDAVAEEVLARLEPGGEIPEVYARIFGDSSQVDRRGELRDKYLGVENNRTAYSRWFRHQQGPRPCAVLLHGYMAGILRVERWLWPLRRLFNGGMDVVLSVLPFHGPRRDARRGMMPPAFPSNDPRFTIEGFRQTVFDQTALFDFLLDGRASALGVMGMSLGGYSAALLSTIEPRLGFSVLYIALGQIEDFALRFGRMVGDEQQQSEQAEAMRRAQWPINPLARPSLLPPERVRVIAGEHDQVTGISHAEKLAGHFGTPVELFSGGHILQGNRARAFESAFRMLEAAGFWSA